MTDPIHSADHGHPHHMRAENSEELKALLQYNLHHNASHLEELIQIAGRFTETGNPDAGRKILAATEEFKKGNRLLEEAFESLK